MLNQLINPQQETIDEFLDRIYVNFELQIVFVHQNKKLGSTAEKWTLKNARDYISFLRMSAK